MSMEFWRGRIANPLRVFGWSMVAIALLVPLAVRSFTREVCWTNKDYLFAVALLIGAGLVMELASRTIRQTALVLGVFVAVVLAVLLFWAQGAVGIF